MFTDTGQRSRSSGETGRRSRRRGRRSGAALLAAMAVSGLLATTASGAQPPSGGATMFTHSAAGGELRGGRLILHGVSGRVTWAHHSGRSGVMAVKPMHRMLFKPNTSATGTLHVAGHRGGDELTFKLSRPRHDPAHRTVSYKAKPLGNGRFPRRAALAAAATRQFGPASLTIQASQPSVRVDQTIYACGDPGETCWGTISVSGLNPGGPVTLTAPFQPGGQWEEIDITLDANGNISGDLGLLCSNTSHVVSPYVNVDASWAGGPVFTVNMPDSCG
jgi:hypothetical protein